MSPVWVGVLAALLLQPGRPSDVPAISGRVIEGGTGAPIANAVVTLFRVDAPALDRSRAERPLSTVTGADGVFRFQTIDPGRYHLRARKGGFADDMTNPPTPIVTTESSPPQQLDLVLQRGAVIVGRVLDQYGEPVVRARVMALRRLAGRDRGPLVPGGSGAETNDLGEFRVFGLGAGEYVVSAEPSPNLDLASGPTVMLPTYFPGTAEQDEAQRVTLRAGETSSDVVIRLITAAAFQIRGVVVDEQGSPVVNAVVRLLPPESAGPMFFRGPADTARTDAKGAFSLPDVTNGTHTLLAIAPVIIGRVPMAGAPGGSVSGTFGSSLAMAGGGGVMTETRDGTTVEYRDDAGTRVTVSVNDRAVSGLRVVVRRPDR